MQCQNFSCMFFLFVTKHACNGQTDGQNYNAQDRASIAASRGKNLSLNKVSCIKVKLNNQNVVIKLQTIT